VHEATHARVAHWCGTRQDNDRPREERLCRRAELEFGLRVPHGEVVVERARGALAMNEEGVAPTVDWREAARRVAEADEEARGNAR